MAKIVAFGEYKNIKKQEEFKNTLQKEIETIEKKLNIPEGEDLLVLTDMDAIIIANCLLDAKNEITDTLENINKVLNILNIEESEELPQ